MVHSYSYEGFIEAVNEYLGEEKAFNFEGIRKLERRCAKHIALKGDNIGNYSLVARSTRGR